MLLLIFSMCGNSLSDILLEWAYKYLNWINDILIRISKSFAFTKNLVIGGGVCRM